MIAFGSLRLSLVFSLLGLANVSGFLDSFPPNTFSHFQFSRVSFHTQNFLEVS